MFFCFKREEGITEHENAVVTVLARACRAGRDGGREGQVSKGTKVVSGRG